jgi:hypothetical protein
MPEQDVDRVTSWCRTRLPESVHDAVRTECEVTGDSVTIIESRVPSTGSSGLPWSRCPVARLQFRGTWSLYWRDRRGAYQRYEFLAPSARVDDLLAELDRDPVAVFWG